MPRRLVPVLISVGLATVTLSACRDRKPKPLIEHAAVVKCERGVNHAGKQPTLEKATAAYYSSCADIHAEAACKKAFLDASKAKVDAQLGIIVDGCKKAYCPILGADRFELCKPTFQATEAGMTRAWPPFHGAIVERDAKALASRVENALLGFYIRSQALKKAEEEKAKEEAEKPKADAGSAADSGAAPAGSAAPAPPTSSASAPSPAASASATKAP